MTTATPIIAAQVVSPAPRAGVISDDDDEIVYPVSSQSSSASTTPVLAEDTQGDLSVHTTGSDVAPLRGGHNDKGNDNASDSRDLSKTNDRFKGDPFSNDFVLERGDAGSKVWTPPPNGQRARPRGRGHRSTKSEPPLPAVPLLPASEATLEPLKESWADDVKGLEVQMARASLGGSARPRSTPGVEVINTQQSPASTPRKQRSQKKQKGKRSARGASAPGTRSVSANANSAAQSYPSPASTPSPTKPTSGMADAENSGSPAKKKPKKGKSKNKAKKDLIPASAPSTAPSTPRGLGRRSIVDDISENGDAELPPQSWVVPQTDTDRLLGIAYDEAVKFMNEFIQNPDYYTSRASRLTFLQALIVELGLVSTTGPERTLPESLTAARALLKSHAFLNVKDYLALREKGIDALRSAMRPSRTALVKDLRGRNGRRAKVGWVKETGLSVLLVSCQY